MTVAENGTETPTTMRFPANEMVPGVPGEKVTGTLLRVKLSPFTLKLRLGAMLDVESIVPEMEKDLVASMKGSEPLCTLPNVPLTAMFTG